MKQLLAVALLLLSAFSLMGQPIQKNYYTTNAAPASPGTATNAVYATNAGYATLAGVSTNLALPHALRLARPPGIGKTLSGSYADTGNNSDFALLAPPGSSGVIENIWCVPNVEGTHKLYNLSNNIRFQVFVDMASNTNGSGVNPYLALDIPLSHIFNNQFRRLANGHWMTQRGTPAWDVCDMSTNFLANSSLQSFNLKLKIPFTNGVFARLTNAASANSNWAGGYIASMASTGTLSSEYINIRLKSKSVNQQNTGNSGSNFLFTVATAGYAAQLIGGIQNTQSSTFFQFVDSHGFVFWLDGTTRWTASGLDDMFKRTYGMSQGEFVDYDYGALHYVWNNNLGSLLIDPTDGQAIFEGFREFNHDPFRWNSSLHAYTDGNQNMNNQYWTFLYYEILP